MQLKQRLLHLILLLPDSELVKYLLVRRNIQIRAQNEYILKLECTVVFVLSLKRVHFHVNETPKVWDHLNESSINECYTVWCTFMSVVAFYRREFIFLIFCSIWQSQIQQWLVKDFFYHSVHYTLYQVGNIKLNIFMLYKQIKLSA